ncbi:maleylpyruvate isomerase N-terminal domain-containing protein [Mucilaginibacter phyllosphaerae]
MQQVIPISTLHLFPLLDELLIDLLDSLSPEDWQKPTLARLWTVKDIAAHLLDGNVRAIAALDGYEVPVSTPINNNKDLVDYLNSLNAVWVNAMKRVSPQLLINQLKSTGKQYIAYLHTLQPFEQARFSVAWAGEQTSLNWFHIAREYTEKWHHQQQIREAVGKPGLMTRQLFYPCIATLLHALPYTYHHTDAHIGTILKITISSEIGGEWYLLKLADKWILVDLPPLGNVTTQVIIAPDIAWKLFTKGVSPLAAINVSTIHGDIAIGKIVFNTIAVMA